MWKISILVFVLSLVLACREAPLFPPAGPDAAPSSAQYGPYPVGVKTVSLRDPGRNRQIVTEIWYPSTEEFRGAARVSYSPADAIPEEIVTKLGDARLEVLETYAVRDADIRHDDAPFPIILFSHGSGGVRFQSTHLTVALASHGYVVFAPDHQGNTLRDLLNAAEIVPAEFLESYLDRAEDLQFLLDWLERGDDKQIVEISDLSRVGAIGHSFGSLTAVRLAGLDSRIDVSIAQAPAGYLATWLDVGKPITEIGVPVMLQVAGLDRTLPPDAHAETLWKELPRPRYRVDFPTGGHFTFSDLCRLELAKVADAAGIDVGNVLEDGCGEENIVPEVAFPLIRRTAIGLFNAVLRDSPRSLEYVSTVDGIQVTADP
jgi:predicted dienelactone hydrolase